MIFDLTHSPLSGGLFIWPPEAYKGNTTILLGAKSGARILLFNRTQEDKP